MNTLVNIQSASPAFDGQFPVGVNSARAFDVFEEPSRAVSRHGAFRWLFDEVVRRCMVAGLVKGEGFAVDANVVAADASRQRRVSSEATEWKDRSRRSTRAAKKVEG